jgi:siderophore synthetase component
LNEQENWETLKAVIENDVEEFGKEIKNIEVRYKLSTQPTLPMYLMSSRKSKMLR